jgi:uncharacterized membrane protein
MVCGAPASDRQEAYMTRLKSFVLTTVLGGLMVILPATIVMAVFNWLFVSVANLIQPLTNLLMARSQMREFVATVAVLVLMLAFCFLVGLAVRTGVGHWINLQIENALLKKIPGYSLVKETLSQFLGPSKQSPFSSVALVQIFENQTLATERHEDGRYSVFVPTGPNPTSGQIFHLKPEFVHPVDVKVEDAMRSIIACGSGSKCLVESLHRGTVAS